MIKSEMQLDLTREHVATLRSMREATRIHLEQVGSPNLIPLLTEGYDARIKILEGEIDEYVNRREERGRLLDEICQIGHELAQEDLRRERESNE